MDCNLCKLHITCPNVGLPPVGDRGDVMVIVSHPSTYEGDTGVAVVDRKLGAMMHEAGIKSFRQVYAVRCSTPENRAPSKREISTCHQYLKREIERTKPKYILLMGATPLLSVTGKTGIKKLRGRPIEQDGIVYLPTLAIGSVFQDPALEKFIARDLTYFKSIIDFGGIPFERAVDYCVVDSRSRWAELLEALTGVVSYDLETTGLYPWQGKVVSVGFGTRNKQFILPVSAEAWDVPWTVAQARAIMRDAAQKIKDDCILVGHNVKFDMLWTRVFFGIELTAAYDTMLAHYLIDENDRHGLDHLAGLFMNAHDWDVPLELKTGRAGKFEDHARYLASDVYYTRELKFVLDKIMAKDPDTRRVFKKIMMPCANMFTEIEFNGIHINTQKMDEAEVYLRNELHAAETALKPYGDINWGSPQQVAKLLFDDLGIDPLDKTASGAPSTSESVIKRIDHPCAQSLLRMRAAKQQLSFFIEGWKPFLVNGRLHPSFKLHGTVTGRLSAEHPNLQQVPRDPRIRSLITAPPGWVLGEADLSQIELRIAAELAGEKEMLHAFHTGIDVHWRTALSELARGGGGDYTKIIFKSVDLYLMQLCLPTNGTGVEVLLRVWNANKKRASTAKLLQLSHQAWDNQKPGSGEWWKSGERIKSLLEGWRASVGTEVSEELVRALRGYFELVYSSQGRKPGKQSAIQFGDAMSILSLMGPSAAQKFFPEWKELRKKAKAVGFGYLYGMWWKKFKVYARDNYGVIVTDQEAQASREAFFSLYEGLTPWHKNQRQFVRAHGYVSSLSGRKRRLPHAMSYDDTPERREAERQAINSPVQSFANELNLMAALQLHEEFGRDEFNIVGTVHDAILFEMREDMVEEIMERVLEVMSHPELLDIFGIDLGVPVEADGTVGPWGSGVSWKDYKNEQSNRRKVPKANERARKNTR